MTPLMLLEEAKEDISKALKLCPFDLAIKKERIVLLNKIKAYNKSMASFSRRMFGKEINEEKTLQEPQFSVQTNDEIQSEESDVNLADIRKSLDDLTSEEAKDVSWHRSAIGRPTIWDNDCTITSPIDCFSLVLWESLQDDQ